jgi:CYTH domain-containing protein
MSFSRRFLVAPSLVRLLNRDLGADRVIEGYFANQPERSSYVRLVGETGTLVLLTEADGVIEEERTDIPRPHAEALLDVAPGRVAFARVRLDHPDVEISLDHFIEPRPLSLATVSSESAEAISRFHAPAWFGAEVTTVDGFQNRQIALDGAPPVRDVPVSDVAVHACLDLLEGPATPSAAPLEEVFEEESDTVDALLRFASAFSGSAAPEDEKIAAPEPDAAQPKQSSGKAPEGDDDSIRALAWSLRPQSSRKKDKSRT